MSVKAIWSMVQMNFQVSSLDLGLDGLATDENKVQKSSIIIASGPTCLFMNVGATEFDVCISYCSVFLACCSLY